jgi:hypothetical protein
MSEAEIGRIAVLDQLGQKKFMKSHVNRKKAGCTPVIPVAVGIVK